MQVILNISKVMRSVLTKDQQQWLDFLIAMTEKEIKARYKHAVLGFLWVILNPILQMAVIGFVFQFFVPVNVDNYFLFLFAGLLPWNFFSFSVTKTTPSIVYERSLIQKAKFPRESIILSIVLSNLFHFAISLGLLILLLVFDKVLFESYSFLQLITYILRLSLVFPLMMVVLLLTSGVSLLTSALNVKYRDVFFIVQAIMPLWFYATPIIYGLNLLPERLRLFFYLNPMTGVIESFQCVLLNQHFGVPGGWLISLLVGVSISILGIWVFRRESPLFDDWV